MDFQEIIDKATILKNGGWCLFRFNIYAKPFWIDPTNGATVKTVEEAVQIQTARNYCRSSKYETRKWYQKHYPKPKTLKKKKPFNGIRNNVYWLVPPQFGQRDIWRVFLQKPSAELQNSKHEIENAFLVKKMRNYNG